jgi:transcriptional regulator with XRE-family HTH domain
MDRNLEGKQLMTTNLGRYFRAQRIDRGLSLGQIARMVGYRNVSKGANRIARFERDGIVNELLLIHLAEALEIDLPTVEDLMEQDRQEYLRAWEAWVNQPVPMCLVVKYLPAVYGSKELPEGVKTPEDAEKYACDYARRNRRQVCLAVSRRLSVWVNKEGEVEARTEATPEQPNMPYMRLRGSNGRFLWSFKGD